MIDESPLHRGRPLTGGNRANPAAILATQVLLSI
jgi:geranylgeranyl pyrophosphate synthase